MSGSGRKHRAKHLTQEYLDEHSWEELKNGEMLAICMSSPQGNHVRVLCLRSLESQNNEEQILHNEVESKQDFCNGVQSRDGSVSFEEKLILVPGKFRKVIWLSIKDIVVIVDCVLKMKLSPQHLANFLKREENVRWHACLEEGRRIVEERRCLMERLPLHIKNVSTTTSILPTTISKETEKTNEEFKTSIEDDLSEIVNPNWLNIRHKQHYFQVNDNDNSEDEEEIDWNCHADRKSPTHYQLNENSWWDDTKNKNIHNEKRISVSDLTESLFHRSK